MALKPPMYPSFSGSLLKRAQRFQRAPGSRHELLTAMGVGRERGPADRRGRISARGETQQERRGDGDCLARLARLARLAHGKPALCKRVMGEPLGHSDSEPGFDEVLEQVCALVDETRATCLWLLDERFRPASREQARRALGWIVERGTREQFMTARQLPQWLSRISNGTSVDSSRPVASDKAKAT